MFSTLAGCTALTAATAPLAVPPATLARARKCAEYEVIRWKALFWADSFGIAETVEGGEDFGHISSASGRPMPCSRLLGPWLQLVLKVVYGLRVWERCFGLKDSSPDTSTISRSVSSVSSLSLLSSSPTAVSVQAGKRQKLVMLPAAHTESASAPLAAASPSRPLIFVNQSTRATYRSYKVAIDAMAVDESVVPMDLEEATKMISAAGDR
ncbi:hypothetical protein B0H14DRAFT_3489661 [Mycena olivaceomarginata]|nr:hypothetical protein B0H14DRAFT_3489661 [Mycena olivaceomarginata]